MSFQQVHRALITGGSSGIGRAAAELFAQNGIEVGVLSEVPSLVEATVQAIRDTGGKAFPVHVNLAQHDQVEGLIGRVEEEYGPIDVLVNNAGIGLQGDLSECSTHDLRLLFEVNFFAAFTLSQDAFYSMKGRGGGNIINVSSASAKRALPGMGIYASTKAAMHACCQALRIEGEAVGVHVTELLPMTVRTPFFENAQNRSRHDYKHSSFATTPETIARQIYGAIQRPVPEIYTSTLARIVLAFDTLFPTIMDTILISRRRKSQAALDTFLQSAHGENTESHEDIQNA